MDKTFVMYFGKLRPQGDPFADFEHKRKVYYQLFQLAEEKGFQMAVCSTLESYLGGLKFQNPQIYQRGKFIQSKDEIVADAILDRSGGLEFPPKEIGAKVLNPWELKELCWNKAKMYDYLPQYIPKSLQVTGQAELLEKLKTFDADKKLVAKPIRGLKGKGVLIDTPDQLAQQLSLQTEEKYLLQEFVDTSAGIPGLATGVHDLRLAVVNGVIAFSHVRQPQGKNLVANVAQGGSVTEIDTNQLPQAVLTMANEVKNKIDADFNQPIYSIDFGLTPERPYVFEINDSYGFPGPTMQATDNFLNQVLLSLNKRAEIKF